MRNFYPFMNQAIPYGNQSDAFYAILAIIMSVLVIVSIVAIIIGIISYIFMAIGLYTMAKNRKMEHPWLAWIPIANNYLMGDLINDDVSIGSLYIPYAKIFLPLSPFIVVLVMFIFGFVPEVAIFLSVLLSLALAFYQYTALFWLFSIYSEKHRVLFLILSVIFPFMAPIFIFVIRNKAAIDERHPEPVLEVNYDSKSILALSLGILAILSSFSIGGSILVGGVGLIFGIIAMKEQKSLGRPSGMALAGLICSIAGLALTVFIFIACVACIGIGATGVFTGLFNGF